MDGKMSGGIIGCYLSTVITEKTKDKVKVKCLCSGDSPIFIITPGKIYTSFRE